MTSPFNFDAIMQLQNMYNASVAEASRKASQLAQSSAATLTGFLGGAGIPPTEAAVMGEGYGGGPGPSLDAFSEFVPTPEPTPIAGPPGYPPADMPMGGRINPMGGPSIGPMGPMEPPGDRAMIEALLGSTQTPMHYMYPRSHYNPSLMPTGAASELGEQLAFEPFYRGQDTRYPDEGLTPEQMMAISEGRVPSVDEQLPVGIYGEGFAQPTFSGPPSGSMGMGGRQLLPEFLKDPIIDAQGNIVERPTQGLATEVKGPLPPIPFIGGRDKESEYQKYREDIEYLFKTHDSPDSTNEDKYRTMADLIDYLGQEDNEDMYSEEALGWLGTNAKPYSPGNLYTTISSNIDALKGSDVSEKVNLLEEGLADWQNRAYEQTTDTDAFRTGEAAPDLLPTSIEGEDYAAYESRAFNQRMALINNYINSTPALANLESITGGPALLAEWSHAKNVDWTRKRHLDPGGFRQDILDFIGETGMDLTPTDEQLKELRALAPKAFAETNREGYVTGERLAGGARREDPEDLGPGVARNLAKTYWLSDKSGSQRKYLEPEMDLVFQNMINSWTPSAESIRIDVSDESTVREDQFKYVWGVLKDADFDYNKIKTDERFKLAETMEVEKLPTWRWDR